MAAVRYFYYNSPRGMTHRNKPLFCHRDHVAPAGYQAHLRPCFEPTSCASATPAEPAVKFGRRQVGPSARLITEPIGRCRLIERTDRDDLSNRAPHRHSTGPATDRPRAAHRGRQSSGRP
jgi:hypothetical protein